MTKAKDIILTIISDERRKIQAEAMSKGRAFNEHTGWEQVKGAGEEANRLYGSWVALTELYYIVFDA